MPFLLFCSTSALCSWHLLSGDILACNGHTEKDKRTRLSEPENDNGRSSYAFIVQTLGSNQKNTSTLVKDFWTHLLAQPNPNWYRAMLSFKQHVHEAREESFLFGRLTNACNFSSRGSNALCGSIRTCTHTYIHTHKHTHTHRTQK